MTHFEPNTNGSYPSTSGEEYYIVSVFIDGGASVNIITENLITKLGLPKPRPIPYHLKMANRIMTRPLGITRNLKIHIHGVPYYLLF